MIAAWMLYATLVAAVLGVAGLAGERALRLSGRPTRFVWLSAIAGALVLPLLAWLQWRGGHGVVPAVSLTLPVIHVFPENSLGWSGDGTDSLDRALLGAWSVGSALLLLSLVVSQWRLGRERARWSAGNVDGSPVLVSADLGPALVGLASLAIVIPRWLLDLPGETRHLVLLHERQHLEAGDTRLLALAAGLVALAPWNPALWWQVRRLRAAAELDCDARVLRTGVSARAYASALLDVGARSRGWQWLRPAVAEPKSLLSRRIVAMLTKPGKAAWLRVGGYAVAVVALLVLACETPVPERAAGASAGPAATDQSVAGPGIISLGDVQAAQGQPPERVSFPPPPYPAMLRAAGISGRVEAQFVVGTDGRVEPGSIQIVSSTNKAFEAPSRYAIENAVFRPGRVNGQPVRVMIKIPIRFVIPK